MPLILYRPFLYFWKWWRVERWLKTVYKPILLEIKIPKEILKPIRAMENVMASIHGAVYHPPDWWEEWIDGQVQTSLSFEIASIDGEPHFFVRVHRDYRDAVESSIYSQYPGAEIQEVDDYTKKVPRDIPNKNWNLWASDYFALKPNPYPIKTYPKFETEREAKEEKRIDPVASLLEAMAKIKVGEQLWVQITAGPIADDTVKPFIKEGEKIRDKLARRPEEPKAKPLLQQVGEVIITGRPPGVPEEEKEKEIIPPEMKLTPGEREIVARVEEKISKLAFKTNIRFIYLGKREVFFKPNFRLAFSFFTSYVTQDLNALYPWAQTLTKIHRSWFLPLNSVLKRRLYLRQRKIFRNYVNRYTPLFPRTSGDKGVFILNTEELASLYHFPGQAVAPAPAVPRVETKRGEAPSGLPVE